MADSTYEQRVKDAHGGWHSAHQIERLAAEADTHIARLTADLAHADRTIRGLRGTLADVTRERDEARGKLDK